MTRTAFRATLEISNHDPATPLLSVSAQVEIKDAAGNVANSHFQIEAPTLENIDRIDGNGTLVANGTATIRWLLIPSDEAAPTTATEFSVGGQFGYTFNGGQAQVPLKPVKITVYPDAALKLTYFHQRDVFSDDPFTPQVEPSQPYALVVMIKNQGAGAANSLKITAAQPQIIENEKGLLIDFKLIGTSLDGTNLPNTLAMDFGRVEPGSIRIAEWWFTSSLQGFFRDFNATFQHEDNLGNVHLSTIKSVSVHEMEHIVYAGYQFADGKVDCLVNDSPDPASLPDTLYLSDGTTNAVQVVLQSSVSGVPSSTNLSVQLSATMPSGWTYLRVPEPSDGKLSLTRVRRSDGVDIMLGTNIWTTDRTFVGPGQRPIYENVLHLLDYNSTGSYTLTYGDITNTAPTDTLPPTSLVAAMPAQSPLYFPVTWSGQDDTNGSGIASYDIFVSTNGGPYQVWLQHTPLNGAVFPGTASNSYAFYSVATDVTGNHEPAPGGADAQTTVSIFNHAPAFTGIADKTVNEGDIFTLNLTAVDPDLPNDTLTFSLGAGAPPGMTIDSVNGIVQWPTGELDGPKTNSVTVNVRDSGNPALTDSRTFKVVVKEVNTAPVLATIASYLIKQGELLAFRSTASDADLPTNTLTFTLGPGAPSGARVNPTNGIFRWSPTRAQAPSTNFITVIVTDNGIPPLSDSKSFAVFVNDYMELFLGSTVLRTGETGSVPIAVFASASVTNITMALAIPGNNLTNWILEPALPISVISAISNNNQLFLTYFPPAGQDMTGTQQLGQIVFTAVSGQKSAFLPIPISSAAGRHSDGTPVPRTLFNIGEVVVVGDQSLLRATISTNGGRVLTVYGHPGTNYTLESSIDLGNSVWVPVGTIILTNLWQTLDNLNNTNPAIFYRTRQ